MVGKVGRYRAWRCRAGTGDLRGAGDLQRSLTASARGEDAEVVALRVGEDLPWHGTLAEVDVGGAERPQPGHLRLLIVTGVRHHVEMDAVPPGPLTGPAEELQIRADALGRAQRRIIVGRLVQDPVHR